MAKDERHFEHSLKRCQSWNPIYTQVQNVLQHHDPATVALNCIGEACCIVPLSSAPSCVVIIVRTSSIKQPKL